MSVDDPMMESKHHLPECPATDCGCTPDEECGPDCCNECICDRLRAAEQRVREEYESQDCYTLGRAHGMSESAVIWATRGREQFDLGYADALGKARGAAAGLPAYYAIEECQGSPLEKGDPEDPDPWKQGHLIERDDTLAAIDALLKEKL